MDRKKTLTYISRGRTDLVFRVLDRTDWRETLADGTINALQWFVYYGDVTALRAVLQAGGDLDPIDLDSELRNAAFFGHWKVCDFLVEQGANVNSVQEETGETPLHCALCKAGRPYFIYVVRLLLEHGADPNAQTIAGTETGAFMRDIRNCGETPLHRAAAYSDLATINLLIENGSKLDARDANGDSPLGWASRHLRPGNILSALAFGDHRIGPNHARYNTSDHGAGWGNGMDWNLMGDYLSLS